MRCNPGCDLAREIRRHRDRAIALLGLGPADSGLALFAILQGFVDSELRSVKILHPKNEDLGRPKTTGCQNVQDQMLTRCRLRKERADLLQAEKAFAYLFSNRGHFQLARGIL